jgi:pseudaminic acid cytidylyltransferase
MRSLCVIPARGGSKRIPGKNIRDFCGKPIIAWSIEAARKAACFERIIVSTDDEDVAQVATEWGADVPFVRPSELADDITGTSPVVAHAVETLEQNDGPYDAACCIYATAPFIRLQDIATGLQRIESGWAFAFPVTDFSAPIFRSFRVLPDGGVEMNFPDHFSIRSQDFETAYHDAGQFYWGTTTAWKTEKVLFGPHSAAIPIPRRYVQDIDTEEDWIIAERMFQIGSG